MDAEQNKAVLIALIVGGWLALWTLLWVAIGSNAEPGVFWPFGGWVSGVLGVFFGWLTYMGLRGKL